MKIKKVIPIKRQNSSHCFIDCKSLSELKMNTIINKCQISHKNSMDLPFNTTQIKEYKNKKISFKSKIILKPIIKDKSEFSKNVTNFPLLYNQNTNKLKMNLRHSNKSKITLPFYTKNKFQKDKIELLNKIKKDIPDKTLSLYLEPEFDAEEEEKKKKFDERLININIIYQSEKCISATQKGFIIRNNKEKEISHIA